MPEVEPPTLRRSHLSAGCGPRNSRGIVTGPFATAPGVVPEALDATRTPVRVLPGTPTTIRTFDPKRQRPGDWGDSGSSPTLRSCRAEIRSFIVPIVVIPICKRNLATGVAAAVGDFEIGSARHVLNEPLGPSACGRAARVPAIRAPAPRRRMTSCLCAVDLPFRQDAGFRTAWPWPRPQSRHGRVVSEARFVPFERMMWSSLDYIWRRLKAAVHSTLASACGTGRPMPRLGDRS